MIIGISIGSVIILLIALIYTYYFRLAFARKKPKMGTFSFAGSENEEHKRKIKEGREWFENHSKEDVFIESYDGLKLHAYYVKTDTPSGKLIIMFHGYRSSYKDFSCAFQYYAELGFDMLVVDQRSHGMSEGKIISYGVKERFDVVSWLEYAKERFGDGYSYYLDGISMGASTVLMAAGKPLPKNVVGVLADCGFSSPKNIIQKCAKDQHYPVNLIYPFIKLGAKIFGHFDLEEYSPLEAMKTCNVPVIFFHGEDDNYVPCYMSREIYDVCTSPKKLVTIPGAGHGLVYLVDNQKYFQSVVDFFSANGVDTRLIK